MRLEHLTMERLEIPFKQSFSHASAIRKTTETVIVKAIDAKGAVAYGEGCPRQYVTGETINSALQFFERVSADVKAFRHLDDVAQWVESNAIDINANPAAWCAIELALLDLMACEAGRSVESSLGLPELSGIFQYSAVIGADDPTICAKQLQRYVQQGFTDFKIKVSGDFDRDKENIALLRDQTIPLTVRMDANNVWTDKAQAIEYIQALDYEFKGIEEPLGVNDYAGCQTISTALKIPVILDESFLNITQFAELTGFPGKWIINLRISKMGGLLRSLTIAEMARSCNIPIIIGAQVGETSILTRAALTVANAYKHQTIAQEGAFGTYLLSRDITPDPIMFGPGGKLDVSPFSGRAGFSIDYDLGCMT